MVHIWGHIDVSIKSRPCTFDKTVKTLSYADFMLFFCTMEARMMLDM